MALKPTLKAETEGAGVKPGLDKPGVLALEPYPIGRARGRAPTE